MQDALLDIRAEAHRMAVVYANAVLNIAALNCPEDINTGTMKMCGEREPQLVHPSTLDLDGRQLQLANSWEIRDKDLWTDELEKSPLVKRGWILQEQVLARRTLYFGQNQMLWLCSTGAACETYPDGVPQQIGLRSGFRFMRGAIEKAQAFIQNAANVNEVGPVPNQLVASSNLPGPETPQLQTPEMSGNIKPPQTLQANVQSRDRDSWEVWDSLVEQYSRRDLTKTTDKLIAIAGITSFFQSHLQDQFLAGLWLRHMPLTLLWKVVQGMPATENYRAPSWSWASIDGSIEPSKDESSPRDLRRPVSRVVNYSPETSAEYRFGEVEEGTFIKLEAPAAELHHETE
jgi:hypothetical protein